MHPHLLHNGQIRSTSEPLLSPGQTGFLNGWGVFSTLRVANGVLFVWDRHYRRMQRDAERMHVPFQQSSSELKADLHKLIAANQVVDGTLRVAITRNRGGLFEGPSIENDADVVAFTTGLNDWGAGVKLGYMPNARFGASPFAGTKYTSWSENLTMYETAHQRGFDEFVLLNELGQVSECTSANIFAIVGDAVVTPPLSTSGCLAGITRALLLEEVSVPGLTITERELSPCELEDANSVFITSSTRDLLPALSIDNFPLQQNPDRFTALNQAFGDLRSRYIAEEVERSHIVAA